MRLIIFVLATLLISCSHSPRKSVHPATGEARSIQAVASQAQLKEARELARDQASVLKKKKTQKQALIGSAVPQKKKLEFKPLKNKMGEQALFNELQDRYDLNDQTGFLIRYQTLLKKYPKSRFAAQAHYMSGLLSLTNRHYGQALRSFNLILKAHAKSPQAPQAMFAKAITYKRMNLSVESRQLLRQLPTRYPKSLEAQRAQLELQIAEKR